MADDYLHNTTPRAIALMNQKGGVGKTTTTVNLGAALASAGLRVLLIDLDPQGHLTLHFGIEPNPEQATVYDLLIDPDCTPEDVIVSVGEHLDLLQSEVDLAAAETELAGQKNPQCIMRQKLQHILNQYDVVLFDCPPSLGYLTLNALVCAREVFIPMQAHFLPLQGVGKLLETVHLVSKQINPTLRVTAIILCAYEANTTLAREILADLEEFFENAREQDVPWSECRILEPYIRRNIKLAEAPSFGQTIFDYAPWCAGANDYRSLAERMLERWIKEESESVLKLTNPQVETKAESLVIEKCLRDEIEQLDRAINTDLAEEHGAINIATYSFKSRSEQAAAE